MVTMSVPNKTLFPTLRGWKWGHLVFDRKRLEPREFPWQWHYGCLGFCCDVHVWCKSKEHRFVTSRDIVYSVLCHVDIIHVLQTSWPHYFCNLHKTKTSVSLQQKTNSKNIKQFEATLKLLCLNILWKHIIWVNSGPQKLF